MTTARVQLDEPTHPYPPRYWWLKRITLISLAMSVAFVALMAWWHYEADRRLQDEVAAIRAAGEPLLIEDFATAPVADADNAALSLKSATAANTLAKDLNDYIDTRELLNAKDDQAITQLRRVNAASSAMRQHVRRARLQPQTDWQLTLSTPILATPLTQLHNTRELLEVISCSAEFAYLSGNHSEAIELIRDVLDVSRRLERYYPGVVTHLTAFGSSYIATNLVWVIAADLHVAPGRAASQPSGAASRLQVEALIAELLDERDTRAGLLNAMRGERMYQYDSAMYYFVQGNPGFFGPFGMNPWKLLTPMFMLGAQQNLQRMAPVVRGAQAPNYPSAIRNLPPRFPPHGTALTNISRLAPSMLGISADRVFLLHARALTHRRVAALRLAIRSSQLDHDGSLPSKLEELIPNYIPALPLDPFDASNQPLRYVTSPKPRIYSVWENGIDEGGSTRYLGKKQDTGDPGSADDPFATERADAIFPIGKPKLAVPTPTNGN